MKLNFEAIFSALEWLSSAADVNEDNDNRNSLASPSFL